MSDHSQMFPVFGSIDAAIKGMATNLLRRGNYVSPRGLETLEISPVGFTLKNPRRRLISIPERRWNFRLAIGEFCWHMSGSDNAQFIAYYAPRWLDFSEDLRTISGSCYGKKIFRKIGSREKCEWDKIVDLLKGDSSTRRAIIYFDSPNSMTSLAEAKDISCTSCIQFLIRDNLLNAIVYMRSNDLIWGLPYDVFFFTMLQELMACTLGIDLGSYSHIAGSMHVYEKHYKLIPMLAASRGSSNVPMSPMNRIDKLFDFLSGEQILRESGEMRLVGHKYWDDLLQVLATNKSSL